MFVAKSIEFKDATIIDGACSEFDIKARSEQVLTGRQSH